MFPPWRRTPPSTARSRLARRRPSGRRPRLACRAVDLVLGLHEVLLKINRWPLPLVSRRPGASRTTARSRRSRPRMGINATRASVPARYRVKTPAAGRVVYEDNWLAERLLGIADGHERALRRAGRHRHDDVSDGRDLLVATVRAGREAAEPAAQDAHLRPRLAGNASHSSIAQPLICSTGRKLRTCRPSRIAVSSAASSTPGAPPETTLRFPPARRGLA